MSFLDSRYYRIMLQKLLFHIRKCSIRPICQSSPTILHLPPNTPLHHYHQHLRHPHSNPTRTNYPYANSSKEPLPTSHLIASPSSVQPLANHQCYLRWVRQQRSELMISKDQRKRWHLIIVSTPLDRVCQIPVMFGLNTQTCRLGSTMMSI